MTNFDPKDEPTLEEERANATLRAIRVTAAECLSRGEGVSALRQMESDLRGLVGGCGDILAGIRAPEASDLPAIKFALRGGSFGKARQQTEYSRNQTSPEVLFERNLLRQNLGAPGWYNQMPIWSGLNGSGNTAHVDLVFHRAPGDICLIELKIGSDHVAYAFAEVISYAIGIEFVRVLRTAREQIEGKKPSSVDVLDAAKLTCVALTPRKFRHSAAAVDGDPEEVRKWCREADAYLRDLTQRTNGARVKITTEWWRMNSSDPGEADVDLREKWIKDHGLLIDLVKNAEHSAIRAA